MAGAVYAPLAAVYGSRGRLRFVARRRSEAISRRDFVASIDPLGAAPARRARQSISRRPETEGFLAQLPIGERKSAGSSLKFCVIAEGGADVYPRFAPTMEWDIAAGDAVLRAAGGVVLDAAGEVLAYGKVGEGLRNRGFVAWGDVNFSPGGHR